MKSQLIIGYNNNQNAIKFDKIRFITTLEIILSSYIYKSRFVNYFKPPEMFVYDSENDEYNEIYPHSISDASSRRSSTTR